MNRDTRISASVIICDPIDRVLLAKRSSSKFESPGLWETIGGTLKFGESPEDCVKREVSEEIGCRITNLQLFDVYNYFEGGVHLISIVYLGVLFGLPCINKMEIDDIKWISEHEVDNIDFAINCKQRIIDYFRFLKSQKQILN